MAVRELVERVREAFGPDAGGAKLRLFLGHKDCVDILGSDGGMLQGVTVMARVPSRRRVGDFQRDRILMFALGGEAD